MSHQSFRGLGVSAHVVDALAARSIHEPFSIQALVLPDALGGLDVLAKSPTGSGKTLAFALPIVERVEPRDGKPSVLVLVPTRELAQQVTDELRFVAKPKGLRVAPVYGGVPIRSQAAKAREAHVVVATPGRLEDLAQRKLISARPDPDPRPRRGRPHARHGLQAPSGQARPPGAEEPPDDVLLGHARRRGRRARACLHLEPFAVRGRAAGRPVGRRDRAPLRLRSTRARRWRRSSSISARTRG